MDVESQQDCRAGGIVDLLILSDVRFVREGLADVLGRDAGFRITGLAVDLAQAWGLLAGPTPNVILIDTSLPQGLGAVGRLRERAPDARIVAFALQETETEVIAWAQAGICGYIPRNTPLGAIVELLRSVVHGEQTCATKVASGMLRWIAQHARGLTGGAPQEAPTGLTARELEIAKLIGTGLSNKEISRRLGISVATTKSHVHNILSKLGVARRVLAVRRLREHRERI